MSSIAAVITPQPQLVVSVGGTELTATLVPGSSLSLFETNPTAKGEKGDPGSQGIPGTNGLDGQDGTPPEILNYLGQLSYG
jgi:hypothetical protein